MPVVYRAPSRVFPQDRRRNATANGTLDHLPQEQVRALSLIYSEIAEFDELQKDEAKATADPAPLAFDGSIDAPATR